MIEADLVGREGNIAKFGGEFLHAVLIFLRGDSASNDEAHHLISVKVRIDIGNLGILLECDVLVLVIGEVEDNFPTLGHRDVKLGGLNWLGEESCIGTDNLK